MISPYTLNLIDQFLEALVKDSSLSKYEYREIISLLEANSGQDNDQNRL